ncbi:MAG: hypothetical protein MUC41_14515 [Syntrophobacteraceae bacterium]|nr:hypothetical protein [Syntrophobacteraceae bacterium]
MLSALMILSPACRSFAAESGPTDEEKAARFLYGEFREVRSFGMIAVSLVGQAEQLGLRTEEVTRHARNRFRDYFSGVRLEDISSDSRKFLALMLSRDRTVGNITFRIWVLGDELPIVYHIKCDAGNFDNPSIWTEEALGHASGANLQETVLGIVDEMLKTLAVAFMKVRAQEM